MSAPWSSDFWARIGAGVNPITALTTGAPKSGPATSSSAYDADSAQRNADARAGLAGAPGSNVPAVAAPPTGAVAGASAGGGAAAPAIDPNVAKYKGEAAARIQSLMHAYDMLFNQVDTNVADQKATYDQGFDTAQTSLGKNFDNTTGQINMNMAGRGLADSSYLGDAQGQARDSFNSATDSLNQGRDTAYAQLGKFATTQKASLGAGREAAAKIDLSQYTDPQQLLSLRDQIDAQIASTQQTAAGLGTNAQFRGALAASAPAASDTGSAKLQKQLDTLSQSSASPMTKNTIAAGLIRSAGIDPTQSGYWIDYFQKLGGGGVAQTAV